MLALLINAHKKKRLLYAQHISLSDTRVHTHTLSHLSVTLTSVTHLNHTPHTAVLTLFPYKPSYACLGNFSPVQVAMWRKGSLEKQF